MLKAVCVCISILGLVLAALELFSGVLFFLSFSFFLLEGFLSTFSDVTTGRACESGGNLTSNVSYVVCKRLEDGTGEESTTSSASSMLSIP